MSITQVAELEPQTEVQPSGPAVARARAGARWLVLPVLSVALFGVVAAYTATTPNWRFVTGTDTLVRVLSGAGALLLLLIGVGLFHPALARRLRHAGGWLIAVPLLLGLWEVATAKKGWLPLPYFPPPQTVMQVYVDDLPTLARSVAYSLRLLLLGSTIGAVSGFVTGVAIGWSRVAGYWVHPVLKGIGPVPALAWLPVAFVVFPSSFSASTFLIALAAWFPVTVLTWSGIAGVQSGYYDVARTLGAGQWFLVSKVAIPAALPHVFVGLFMGFGSTFATLIVAEMLGVRAGLGWYIQWAIGWAAYAKMYAALIVMAILFSGLLSIVFAVRDHFLSWQKGILRW